MFCVSKIWIRKSATRTLKKDGSLENISNSLRKVCFMFLFLNHRPEGCYDKVEKTRLEIQLVLWGYIMHSEKHKSKQMFFVEKMDRSDLKKVTHISNANKNFYLMSIVYNKVLKLICDRSSYTLSIIYHESFFIRI